jgi:hypothetical protein
LAVNGHLPHPVFKVLANFDEVFVMIVPWRPDEIGENNSPDNDEFMCSHTDIEY